MHPATRRLAIVAPGLRDHRVLTRQAHHVCVVCFMVLILYSDFSEETVLRAVVVYAVFRSRRRGGA